MTQTEKKTNDHHQLLSRRNNELHVTFLLFTFRLGSHIITCQTASSDKPDEQPTLFKLPLHALHLRLVATHAVQALCVEP